MSTHEHVERLYADLLRAWNERDWSAWSDCFADDGSLVGFDGSQLNSRTSIAEHLREIFGDHEPARYVGKVRECRALGGDAALLRAVAGMVPPGQVDLKPELHTVHSLVAVERSGTWLVALLQSTPARFDGRPDAQAALTNELKALLDTTGR